MRGIEVSREDLHRTDDGYVEETTTDGLADEEITLDEM